MSPGRPNIYTEIIRELGGSATANEIYIHGSKKGLINCSMESCKTALYVNLRKGNIVGKVQGKLMAPDANSIPLPKAKPPKFLHEYMTQISERLLSIENRLASIEAKQPPTE